jgi:hypothetical protein
VTFWFFFDTTQETRSMRAVAVSAGDKAFLALTRRKKSDPAMELKASAAAISPARLI